MAVVADVLFWIKKNNRAYLLFPQNVRVNVQVATTRLPFRSSLSQHPMVISI